MSFDRKIKKIDRRNWSEVRIKWLENIPIFEPGEAPSFQIVDLIYVQTELDRTPNDGERKIEINGLRPSVFHEGIYLFHKSINTFLAAEQNFSSGLSSWSLSSSYHSAFYAAKAFLCFSGITMPKYNGSYYVIDVFPELEKLSRNQIKRGEKPENTMKLIKMNNLLHYHIWKIIQRLINVSAFEFFNESIISTLLSFSEKEFAKQRNEIHYINNYWPLNDLFSHSKIEKFGKEEAFIKNIKTFHPELRNDFSVILALLFIRINMLLLEDITSITNILNSEMELIYNNLNKSETYLCFEF